MLPATFHWGFQPSSNLNKKQNTHNKYTGSTKKRPKSSSQSIFLRKQHGLPFKRKRRFLAQNLRKIHTPPTRLAPTPRRAGGGIFLRKKPGLAWSKKTARSRNFEKNATAVFSRNFLASRRPKGGVFFAKGPVFTNDSVSDGGPKC